MNDDVTKVKTAKDCARRWSLLLEASYASRRGIGDKHRASSSSHSSSSLFDCADLIVPPAHDLVNREVDDGVRRWNDLVARIVVNDGEDVLDDHDNRDDYCDDDDDGGGRDGGSAATSATRRTRRRRDYDLLLDATEGGDKRKQRLMPPGFDYACRGDGMTRRGDDDDYDEGMGMNHRRPKVVSLLDPTHMLDYEEELWRVVFRPVRTSHELERMHALGGDGVEEGEGMVDESTDDETAEIRHLRGCQRTLAVKHNLRLWFAKYSRMDAHSLGRLRVRDRHSNPPRSPSSDARDAGVHTTVRFEILRHSQNLKRGSGVDDNRLEVELHGGQRTLLDLHRLVVEHALDGVVGCGVGGNGVDGTATDALDAGDTVAGGVFYVEDTFYTHGEDGERVGKSIVRWLDGKEKCVSGDTTANESAGVVDGDATTSSSSLRRRLFLGLSHPSTSPAKIVPMSEMKLEDVPLRLGVRYFHMFVSPPPPSSLRLLLDGRGKDEVGENRFSWSLSNESAVFVTGIHTIGRNSYSPAKKRRRYNGQCATVVDKKEEGERKTVDGKSPIIIHDPWASQRHICLACNHSPASVVTVNDELTDAAPPGLNSKTNKVYLQGVPMCSSCYRALHYYPEKQHQSHQDGVGGVDGNADDRNSCRPWLILRPSKLGQVCLVFPIDEYLRLMTAKSLEDVSNSSAF